MYERYSENLNKISGIVTRSIQKKVKSNYAYYPIIIDKNSYGHTRDELYSYLEQNGIHSRKYFYPAINDSEAYNGMCNSKMTPVAHSISEQVLTLPLYADLPMESVDRICELIIQFGKMR